MWENTCPPFRKNRPKQNKNKAELNMCISGVGPHHYPLWNGQATGDCHGAGLCWGQLCDCAVTGFACGGGGWGRGIKTWEAGRPGCPDVLQCGLSLAWAGRAKTQWPLAPGGTAISAAGGDPGLGPMLGQIRAKPASELLAIGVSFNWMNIDNFF